MVGAVQSSLDKEKEKTDDAFENMLKTKIKKKKKQRSVNLNDNNNSNINPNDDKSTNYFDPDDTRDYPYTFLLNRICRSTATEPEVHKLPAPTTNFIGSKKTLWANFDSICKLIVRTPDHVKKFFLTEMNTIGSLDGDGNLILKGRWRPKQIEILLKRYIKEFITCNNCGSPKTTLEKDKTTIEKDNATLKKHKSTRLFILTCSVCTSQRSVKPIKAGFRAITRDDRRQQKKNAQ